MVLNLKEIFDTEQGIAVVACFMAVVAGKFGVQRVAWWG